VYDELYVADLTSWLGDATGAGAQEPFDVVVCADVLQYLGSLDETLRAVAPLIKARSGLFAFTLEELVPGYHAPGEPEAEAAKRGFMLGPSGRFLYTRAYVDRVLREAGLVAETFLPYSPRVERGEPVPGFLYVVRAKRGEAI
jgi:predicted TPR repeat methyltransferase